MHVLGSSGVLQLTGGVQDGLLMVLYLFDRREHEYNNTAGIRV